VKHRGHKRLARTLGRALGLGRRELPSLEEGATLPDCNHFFPSTRHKLYHNWFFVAVLAFVDPVRALGAASHLAADDKRFRRLLKWITELGKG